MIAEKRGNTLARKLRFVRARAMMEVEVSSPLRILPRRECSRVIPLAQTILPEGAEASAPRALAAMADEKKHYSCDRARGAAVLRSRRAWSVSRVRKTAEAFVAASCRTWRL